LDAGQKIIGDRGFIEVRAIGQDMDEGLLETMGLNIDRLQLLIRFSSFSPGHLQ